MNANEIRHELAAALGRAFWAAQDPRPNWLLLADAVLAEFLVVPRSEVDGFEYGWRARPGDRVHPRDDRDAALLTAQRRGGEGVERAALAWTPLPDKLCDGCGSTETRCLAAPARGAIKCCPDCDHRPPLAEEAGDGP
ncbi:hypothetical protein [Nocardia sp. CC227C]|uniref:hypothetical protein n=1 Tax=Nocardia sp. CC227C TaxID=3044562 RepID=UPI00278C2D0A|nr:hypothetical protein [Nocardia sp. CC227C]